MDEQQPNFEKVTEATEKIVVLATLPSPIELVKKSWEFYKEHFTLLVGTFLLPAVLTALFSFFSEDTYSAGASFFIFPGALLLIVVQMIAMVALLHVVVSEGKGITIQDAYKKGLESFFSYLWIAVLSGIIMAVGFLLFIVPGIIFAVWFSFSFFVFVAEDKRGWSALKQSREYVKGAWFAIAGRFLFLVLVSFGSLFALGAIMLFLSLIPGLGLIFRDIAAATFTLLFTPFSVVYMYFMYRALKLSKGAPSEISS